MIPKTTVSGARIAPDRKARASPHGIEVVVTHDVSDFDALSSAIAALKIYPEARVVLGRRLGRDVRTFLSLHKDRFPTIAIEDVDARIVRRVIVVDVRRAGRLGHIAQLRDRILAGDEDLDVHVWDHHASAPDDIRANFERIDRVGSATTLFVETIRARAVDVDPVEATLFALGIHVDTGSLRYSGTTPRDASALAWLLARGARLGVINRYLDQPFSDGQRRALSAVLGAIRVERIGGARVGVAEVREGHGAGGLDEVTSEALALENLHALIATFVVRGGRLQIVARSRGTLVDVGKALRSVGGGGHATAAAALVHPPGADSALETVLSALRADAPRPARVRDVMSSPVQSVPPDALVSDVEALLASAGHTGAPVMRDGRLVGIVSRRDLESAIAKGRSADPVARHMSQPVKTTEEESFLEDALACMVATDVGRLPVLRGDRVIGIVTRRDVLDVLYDGDGPLEMAAPKTV
jgi:tRNA nucleotidyltransferase (CCA-adding enzyme)